MKREIKFRIWYPKVKVMSANIDVFNLPDIDELEPEYRPLFIMQFTGLKDKNGREIYEGDIVNITTVNGSKGKGEVIFDRGSFCVKLTEFSDGNYDVGQTPEINNFYFEAIGNIYENPDLLTFKK